MTVRGRWMRVVLRYDDSEGRWMRVVLRYDDSEG